ncbi:MULTISPECIES: FMN reductase [unclassified Arthrobacter]|uniref:FMN reductase n=1 Tax=unclassified Arthrobacter TaxID=235627 RepID=UPI001CE3856F|nr:MULTISPECIES: FMN reductase [unclassified Arthrobacter]
MTKIVVVSAGLSVPSSSRMLADQLSGSAARALAEFGDQPEVQTIELRDWAVEIANNFVTGFASPRLAETIDAVVNADALVVVSPVFSASYSGLLKSFFDVIEPKALDGMPVLIGGTGGSARHSLMLDHALRPLFSYLRARVIPTAVYAATEDWGAGDGGSQLEARITQAGRELAALVVATPRRTGQAAEESLPFEQLLANLQSR